MTETSKTLSHALLILAKVQRSTVPIQVKLNIPELTLTKLAQLSADFV